MLIPPSAILLFSAMASQFTPPTRAQQLAAIGPTAGLTEGLALDLLLQRVYTFSERPSPLLEAGAKAVTAEFLFRHHDSSDTLKV